MVFSVLYVLYTFIPLIYGNSRSTLAEFFTAGLPQLLLYINPSVIYLGLYTFSKHYKARPESMSALSLAGIASQAIVHGILTVFWALMVRSWSARMSTLVGPALIMSYSFLLWHLVDNVVFAALQGRLLWVAIRGRGVVSSEGQGKVQDEDEEASLPSTVRDFY